MVPAVQMQTFLSNHLSDGLAEAILIREVARGLLQPGAAITALNGEYTSKEYYAEATLPIFIAVLIGHDHDRHRLAEPQQILGHHQRVRAGEQSDADVSGAARREVEGQRRAATAPQFTTFHHAFT